MNNNMRNILVICLLFVSVVVVAAPSNQWMMIADNGSKVSALTVDKQGSSEGEVEATRRIRSALVDTDNLSIRAKNIKIITNNGKVVLKGSVTSEKEVQDVLKVAKSSSPFPVENQLTIAQ